MPETPYHQVSVVPSHRNFWAVLGLNFGMKEFIVIKIKGRFAGISGLAVATLLLAACGNTPENSQSGATDPNAGQQIAPAPDTSAQLLAAAEPFEALTERAGTASAQEREAMIGDAKSAAAAVRPLLSAGAVAEIDQMLTAIDRANASGDTIATALSSIEIYRLIVSAVPEGTKIPVDVSLLDYAGFRYQANAGATPPHWDDMASAVQYANEHWASVALSVRDEALSSRFQTALNEMKQAQQTRDVERARSSATTELDLVDELEQYFSNQ